MADKDAIEQTMARADSIRDDSGGTGVRGNEPRWVAPPGGQVAPAEDHDGLLDTAIRGDATKPDGGTPPDQLIGLVLKNQYRVVRKLGSGGMSSVYLAHNLEFDEKVAVKFLKADGVNAMDLVARFRAEQETLRLLRESRIVKARGDGVTDDGVPFILMELVQGTPLNELLESAIAERRQLAPGTPLEPCIAPERVLRIMIDVCIALEEAHAHRIIHRDLKPANLVVERSAGGFETTKVLDFGIAKALDARVHGGDSSPATATGMIIGTVAYLSPEQAGSGEVVPESDLYSLGATAYHCLTGELPFIGVSMAVAHAHAYTPAPGFAEIAPQLVRTPLLDRLEAIVLRLLAKKPEDRFRSARVLRESLEGLLAGAPPPSEPASPAIAPAPPSRTWVWALAGILIVGSAALMLRAPDAPVEAPRTEVTPARAPETTPTPTPTPPPAAPKVEKKREPQPPKVEALQAVMVTGEEQRSLERALVDCYLKVGASSTHTVRLGGVGRVIVESVAPPHAGLSRCLEKGMPIDKLSAPLGGALELRISRRGEALP